VRRARDVVPQNPIVAAGELAGSTAAVRVSRETGTSIAIAFVEKPEKVSLAMFALAASCAGERTPGAIAARRFSVSKKAAASA
jgi:hypothetical protein